MRSYLFAKLIISITSILLVGYPICKIILKEKKVSILERFALLFGVGSALLTLEMFIFSIVGVKFSIIKLILPWIILAFIVFLKSRKRSSFPEKPLYFKEINTSGKPSIWAIIFLTIIAFEVIYSFCNAGSFVFNSWDAWSMWGHKAKSFFMDRGIFIILLDDSRNFIHLDYPLHFPLLQSYIYLWLGRVYEPFAKILSPLYYLSLLIIFYNILRRWVNRVWALGMTCLLSTVPQLVSHSTIGYTEPALIFYITAGILYTFLWLKNNENCFLYLGGILLGSAMWTKNEGLAVGLLSILILLSIVLIQDKMRQRKYYLALLKYIFIIAITALPWFWFKNSLNLTNDVINSQNVNLSNIFENFHRLPTILNRLILVMVSFKLWNILWVLSVSALILNFKKIAKLPFCYISLSVLFYVGICIFVYIITPYDLSWHLSTSLNRLLLNIVPLILFLDGIAVFS